MEKVVLAAIVGGTFLALRLVFNLGRHGFKKQDLEASLRCPECSTQIPGASLHCPACGTSLQVERFAGALVPWVAFLAVVLVYLFLTRPRGPG